MKRGLPGFRGAVIFLCFTSMKAKDLQQTQFDFLSSIRAPQDLVAPLLPRAYAADVELSGGVADEIRATLKEIDLGEPEYIETFSRKDGFELLLANDCYASDTRDLLAGILNPIEIIDVVLNSIVRYRRKDMLSSMLAETKVRRRSEARGGAVKWIVRMEPAGKRFAYTYEDMGAYMQETWLTSLTLVVDSATMLADELDIVKHARLFGADSPDKPEPSVKRYRYVFTYAPLGGATVPARLTLYIDEAPALTIEASYRTAGKFIVFDTRSICYHSAGADNACLVMKYGSYNLNPSFPVLKIEGDGGTTAKKVKQAAALTSKAAALLKEGKIENAVRALRAIIQNYPGTPQAVEAGKLLKGLPEGF